MLSEALTLGSECRGQGSVKQWVERINAWAQGEIDDYRTNTNKYLELFVHGVSDVWDHKGGYSHPQPGSRLVMSGMGDFAGVPTYIWEHIYGNIHMGTYI